MSATSNIIKIKAKIAEAQIYAKFIAASIGGVLTFGSTLIPAEWAVYATGALVVITAFSVWKFPNTVAATAKNVE